MITTETLDKAVSLLEEGSTYISITNETGITREEALAVANAYDTGNTQHLYREIALAGVLELAAARLRSGEGWEQGTLDDVLNEIGHVYHPKTIILSVIDRAFHRKPARRE